MTAIKTPEKPQAKKTGWREYRLLQDGLTVNLLGMAKPNKKGPTATVDVYCMHCKTQLYTYRKGGKGALVKCFKERISKDFTQTPCVCPGCDRTFARETLVRGTPAFKMIGGKVFAK